MWERQREREKAEFATPDSLRINFLFIADFLSSSWYLFFHYVSVKFHFWPSSGDLPRPRIGMLSLVTPVITVYRTTFLTKQLWIGFETAIFWQCSPGTVETQRLYPLRHGPRRAIKVGFIGLINPIICSPYLVSHSRVRTEFVIVFFKTWCDRQQLWKGIRLLGIRLQDLDEDKKSAISKKINSQIKKPLIVYYYFY